MLKLELPIMLKSQLDVIEHPNGIIDQIRRENPVFLDFIYQMPNDFVAGSIITYLLFQAQLEIEVQKWRDVALDVVSMKEVNELDRMMSDELKDKLS